MSGRNQNKNIVITIMDEGEQNPPGISSDGVFTYFKSPEDCVIKPGEAHMFNTGVRMLIPNECFMLLLPSDDAYRNGVIIPSKNSMNLRRGAFDLVFALKNEGDHEFVVNRGDVIAQAVFLEPHGVEIRHRIGGTIEDSDDINDVKMGNSTRKTEVDMIKNGEVVKTFPSQRTAAEYIISENGMDESKIINVTAYLNTAVTGHRKTAYGYKWRKHEDN